MSIYTPRDAEMATSGRKPGELVPAAEASFDAIGLARSLLRSVRSGALASLDPETGIPLATLVTIATDVDGTPLMLLSRLSAHTRNVMADPRASLLYAVSGKGDPLAHPRLTVSGRVVRTNESRPRQRFLARHPKATLYADFPDFGFFKLEPLAGHLNGGFAKAATLKPDELRLDLTGADGLVAGERGAIDHMNSDHADTIALYAKSVGGEGSGWRLTGLDPEGMDLMGSDRTARVPFPERVTDMTSLRKTLVDMAEALRRAC